MRYKSSPKIYYQCEWSGKRHDFMTATIIHNGVEFPALAICKECAATFDFGGLDHTRIQDLDTIDLRPFRQKEISKLLQHELMLKEMAALDSGVKSMNKRPGSLPKMLDEINRRVGEQRRKKGPHGYPIWRMN